MAMIHVAVRCRPLIKREREQNESIKWGINGNTICQIEGPLKHGGAYVFDNVYDASTTNKDLYDEIADPIINSAMEGFHGTIFAYGQTASGKTFTMMGSEQCPGVIPMTVHQIWDCIENTPSREFLVRVSYMEIYNESVSDLLGDCTKTLDVREEQGKVIVKNLTEEMVNKPEQLLEVMKKGEKNRHFATTNMNERSSRSHTIFRIIIESKDERDKLGDYAVNVSHLNLVDLAGSEKAKQTGASGQRLAEGSFINKSLLTLGQVISQLSDSAGFISYRDSKLTRILQDSLGGNSKTAIICNVTPASIDETHSTLRFASNAKKIKNKPKVNEVLSNEAMLKRYRNTIADLEKELNTYKNQENMAVSKLNEDREEQIKKLRDFFVVSTKQREVKTRMKRRETWCPGKGLPSFAPPGVHVAGLDLACGGLTDALPFVDGPRRFKKKAKKEIINKFELVEEEDFDADLEIERNQFRESLSSNQSFSNFFSTDIGCQTEPDLAKEVIIAIKPKCVHDKGTSTQSPPDMTANSSQTTDMLNDAKSTQDSSDKVVSTVCSDTVSISCQTTKDLITMSSAACQTCHESSIFTSTASQTANESSALESSGNQAFPNSSELVSIACQADLGSSDMVSHECQTTQETMSIACQTSQDFPISAFPEGQTTLPSNLVSTESQTNQHSLDNVSVGSQTESPYNDTEDEMRFQEVEKLSEDLMAHLEKEKVRNEKLENDMKNLLFDNNKLLEDLSQKDADYKELEAYTRWEGDFKNQSIMEKEGVLPGQNPDLLAEIEMLTSKVSKLTDEKQQLKQWYEEAAKDGIQAQEELMDGKDIITRLENELEEKAKLIGEYLDNKDEFSRIQEQDLDCLEKEMQAAKLEEASEQIANLQEQMNSIIADFTHKESSYEITLNELREKNEHLVNSNRDRKGNEETDIKEMQQRVDELMEELKKTETKHELEVGKLKLTIEELQEEAECSLHVDENERIERIIMEKEEYESRVSELELELRELKEGNGSVQNDDTLELIQIRLEKEKANQEIEKLNMALCELTSDKSLMEDHVKELCQTIEELKGESVSIKSEREGDQTVEHLTMELHELQSDKSTMEEHVKELCLIIDELKEGRESEERKCKLLEEEVLNLKADLETYKSHIESIGSVNSPVKTKKGSEEECLMQQLHKEREQHNELRSRYEQLLTESATNKGKLLSETNKELDQQRRLDEMEKARRESIALFSQRSQEQAHEIDGLHKQIHDLKSQLQKASGERELAVHHQQKAQEEIEKLKGELRTFDDLQKLHDAESKRHDMDPEKMMDKIKKMGVRIDLTNQRCQNYEIKNKELEAKAKKTENVIFEKNNLQLQVRDLNQSLDKLRDDYSRIQNTSVSLHTQLANVQLQLDMEQNQLEKVKAEKNMLNEKLNHIDQNKEESEKEKNKVTEELKKVAFENQKQQKEIAKLKEEIEELQQQLNCGISEEAIEDLIKTHAEKLKTSVADAISKTQEEEKQRFAIQLESKLKEEKENADTELENQILAIRDQVLAKQMEERTQMLSEHSQEVNLMQAEHHATLEEMKNEQEKTLQSLQEEHTSEITSLVDSLEELKIKYKACYEELEETADKLEKALAEKEAFEKQHEEDIRQLRSEIGDIQKVQPEKPHQELLDEQKSLHQIEIQCIHEEHEKSKTKLATDIEELKLQFNYCNEKLRETESNLERVTQEKERLEEKQEEFIKTLTEEKEDQSQINELKCLHQTEVKTLIEAHDEEIKILQTKQAEILEVTKTTYQEELDLLKQCVEEGSHTHQGEIDQLKNTHRIAFEEASSSHLTEILELQSAHATEINTLKEQHTQEMELKLQEKVNIEELEVFRQHLTEAQTELESLKEKHQTELDTVKEKHQTELDTVKEKHYAELDSLKEKHYAEVELKFTEQVKYEEEIELLRGCLTEAQAEKEAVEKEHESYVQKSQRLSAGSDSGLHSQRVQDFDEEKAALKKDLEDLESKLEAEKTLTEEKDRRMHELRMRIADVIMKYQDKKKEVIKLEKEVAALEEKLTMCKFPENAKPARDENLEALLEEIKELKKEKDLLQKDLYISDQKLNDVEDERMEILIEKNRLEDEMEKHHPKSEGQEVAKLIDRIKELEAADQDISWYKKCCDEADEELEALKTELATKEKQYKDHIAKFKSEGMSESSDVLTTENRDLKKMVADCKMKIVGLEAALLTAKDPLKQRIGLLEADIKQRDETIFSLKNEVRKRRNEMSVEDSICVMPTKSTHPVSRNVHDGHSGIVLNEKVYCLEAEKFKLSRQLKQLAEENRMLKRNACAEKVQKPKVETPRRQPLRETDVTKKDIATQWESENSPAPLMPRLPREPGYEQFYLDNASSPTITSPKDGCAQQ